MEFNKQNTTTLDLSIQDTNFLKGIALLLLLAHHVWGGANNGRFDDILIHSEPLFRGIGAHCKVCVAIFVVLSGYGLTKGCLNKGGLPNGFTFFLHRYTKLMINYWLIWLLFVPLGVFVFERTFPSVYGENWLLMAISDFFGLFSAINGHPHGYNPTWWFYSCIITLYLLFPILWKLKKYWFLLIPFSIAISLIVSKYGLWGGYFCKYLLSFVCGMALALVKLPLDTPNFINKILSIFVVAILFVLGLFVEYGYLWDASIVLGIIMAYSLFKDSTNKYVLESFKFLGKHSFNIFLFHTFVFNYYFPDLIYWSHNPIVALISIITTCVIISVAIEYLKKAIRLDKLQSTILNYIDRI